MSKNKDIEALHRITGEPYRVCRAKMKANGWDLWGALGVNIFDSLKTAIVTATDAITTAHRCTLRDGEVYQLGRAETSC